MIRVESIATSEFRGIRKMTLDFKGRNFGICGPNGTGKSGVIDALEFGLTGNVSRLAGEGSGEVSLKKHGPQQHLPGFLKATQLHRQTSAMLFQTWEIQCFSDISMTVLHPEFAPTA